MHTPYWPADGIFVFLIGKRLSRATFTWLKALLTSGCGRAAETYKLDGCNVITMEPPPLLLLLHICGADRWRCYRRFHQKRVLCKHKNMTKRLAGRLEVPDKIAYSTEIRRHLQNSLPGWPDPQVFAFNGRINSNAAAC